MYDKSTILAIIPAYNEGKNIAKVIKDIRQYVDSILVINDGSKDNTIEEANKEGAMVISHPFNMGYGVTIQSGYKYAYDMGYKYVLQIDGDCQHDARFIPKLIENVINDEADIVIGSRFMSKNNYKVPFFIVTP